MSRLLRARCAARARRAGFTLLEVVIGLTVVSLVLVNVSTIVRSSSSVYESGSMSSVLEEQAEQAMERISYAVMSARTEDINAPSAPRNISTLQFPLPLGTEGGELIWSDPERIELLIETGQIVNTKSALLPNQRRIVWANHVPGMLEGEVENEQDDNGNELEDEQGLSFDLAQGQVAIRLTLRRTDTQQIVHTRTLETRVTCRN